MFAIQIGHLENKGGEIQAARGLEKPRFSTQLRHVVTRFANELWAPIQYIVTVRAPQFGTRFEAEPLVTVRVNDLRSIRDTI